MRRLPLSARDIHVFCIHLDSPVADPGACLDAAERDRAARFVFDRERRRYVRAHAAARAILAGFLGLPPIEIRFGSGAYGKPYVRDADVDLRFNLSHSGERALLAVTRGREVGIDVEEIRPLECLPLAERFFAVGEVADLRAMPARDRTEGFFRGWTRKEALLKADGTGLSTPLRDFRVDLTSRDGPQLLRECDGASTLRKQWRIVSVAVGDGYVAALAAEAGEWRVMIE